MFRTFLPELRSRSLASRRPTSIADLMERLWAAKPHDDDPDIWPFARGLEYPAVDVAEDDAAVTVTAELPGLEPGDVEVTLDRGVLTLKGEKRFEDEEKKGDYHRIERSYGSFTRRLALPAEVGEAGVSATFDKGVLTIVLPKAAKATARKIEIKG